MRKATILIQDNVDQTYIDLEDILYVHVQKNYTCIYRTNHLDPVLSVRCHKKRVEKSEYAVTSLKLNEMPKIN